VPGADGIRVKDGQRLSLVVNEAAPQPRSFDVVTLVAQQWKRDLGVDLQILRADAGTYAKAIQDADQIQVYHSMVGRADFDVIKSQYAAKNRNTLLNRNPADNSLGDEHLESLLGAVASTPDEPGRIQADHAVQEYLLDQAYVIPLFEEPQVFAYTGVVHGFATEPIARPSFYNTWVQR
jgi:peptide/nickel transport system substrate-binding protein